MNWSVGPTRARRLRFAGAGVVALAILVSSVVDPPSAGAASSVFGVPRDKWVHALAYAGLASAVAYATLPDGRPAWRRLAGLALVVAGYGFGIELVQATLPYRTFDLLDALANLVGAVVGTLPWRWLGAR